MGFIFRGGVRLLGIALALVVVAVAVWWYQRSGLSGWSPALNSRQVATRVLAEYVARRFPGGKALIIGNPFTQRRGQSPEIYAFESAELKGLKEGLSAPGGVEVAYPELRPEFLRQPASVYVDPKTTTPLSFLVAEDSFDRLALAHPDRQIVVSLIGLPVNVLQTRLWRDLNETRLALLLPDWRMLGGRDAIRESVRSEKIAAAVIDRPGAPPEKEVPQSEYQSEFDRRYLLVTKDNIDTLLRSYPQLF